MSAPPSWDRVRPWLPGVALLLLLAADYSVGRSVLIGLLVVVPLLASALAAPPLVAAYGAVAFLVAVGMGFTNRLYEQGGDAARAQYIRLTVIVLMTVVSVVLAVDRTRREQRLTRVTRVADAAQRAILLPVPERVGPVRVAVHYESAASDARIGGDLYGLVPTRFGVRFVVGDVRGKGLEAVRMSAQVLAAFRERAGDHAHLADLIASMDRAVARASEDDEDFVTAVVAEVTPDGVLRVANAGHPAPFLLTDGRTRTLDPLEPRPPLGLGAAASVEEVRLAPGDRVLLYTDGLTEARDPRTRAFLSTRTISGALVVGGDVTAAVASLLHDTVQWAGGALHDDMALVLVEYAPDVDDARATGTDAAAEDPDGGAAPAGRGGFAEVVVLPPRAG